MICKLNKMGGVELDTAWAAKVVVGRAEVEVAEAHGPRQLGERRPRRKVPRDEGGPGVRRRQRRSVEDVQWRIGNR